MLSRITKDELEGFEFSKIDRSSFRKTAFKGSGLGWLAFIVCFVIIVWKSDQLPTFVIIILILVAISGWVFEAWNNLKSRKTNAICSSCNKTYKTYDYSTSDGEVSICYACKDCKKYFVVGYQTEPS